MIRHFAVCAALSTVAAAVVVAGGTSGPAPTTTGMQSAPVAYERHITAGPAPKKCSAGYATGTIGGQPKCLKAGQQCQQKQAADYGKYGFTCTKVGNRYQLNGKSGTKPRPKTEPKTSSKPQPKPQH
jgi:hypothetical protein